MKAWRLQELDCRFETQMSLWAAKDERNLEVVERVYHGLFLRPTSWLESWRNSEIKTFSFDAAIHEPAVVCGIIAHSSSPERRSGATVVVM